MHKRSQDHSGPEALPLVPGPAGTKADSEAKGCPGTTQDRRARASGGQCASLGEGCAGPSPTLSPEEDTPTDDYDDIRF